MDAPPPYADSGESASAGQARHMLLETLQSSLNDADATRRQGHVVIARGRRHAWYGVAAIGAAMGFIVWMLGYMAAGYDDTYEAAVRMNWSMLGVVIGVGCVCYAWGWLGAQRRLKDTGQRLIRRADYQQKMAEARIKEVRDGGIR